MKLICSNKYYKKSIKWPEQPKEWNIYWQATIATSNKPKQQPGTMNKQGHNGIR